jgi:hypothetical protein
MAQDVILGEGGVVSPPSAIADIQPPNGREGLVATFGNIYRYIRTDGSLDPKWQADYLTRIELPFPLTLSWDEATSVRQITCHRRLAGIFGDVFQRVEQEGIQDQIRTFGGCFSFRPQRTGSKLSTHAWGIAIDLNPQTNAQGTAGDMDGRVVAIFHDAGFQWGGHWPGGKKDPMHFQYCSGY